MPKFTVIGSNGFIGSNLLKFLNEKGEDVWGPRRADEGLFTKDLGTVFYCAGFGDCKNDPGNVLEANVLYLNKILKSSKFDKLFYFSSTRVYMNNKNANEEDDVKILNYDNRKLFNLTKLVAEELCLKSEKECYVLRPSNVYGLALESPLFLPSITRNAILDNKIDMFVSPSYEKDYISVNDVIYACHELSKLEELPKVINIASGVNINAKEIAELLKEETNCDVVWHNIACCEENFPVTSVDLLHDLIDFKPNQVLNDIKSMVFDFKKHINIQSK